MRCFHCMNSIPDGAVVAVGDDTYHQCDVSDWKDIKLPEPITANASQ